MVCQAKDVPATVPGRRLEQLDIEALQDVLILKLRVGGSDGRLEHAREVVKKELACRPLQLVPSAAKPK